MVERSKTYDPTTKGYETPYPKNRWGLACLTPLLPRQERGNGVSAGVGVDIFVSFVGVGVDMKPWLYLQLTLFRDKNWVPEWLVDIIDRFRYGPLWDQES